MLFQKINAERTSILWSDTLGIVEFNFPWNKVFTNAKKNYNKDKEMSKWVLYFCDSRPKYKM